MKKKAIMVLAVLFLLSGCNVSPLTSVMPTNKPSESSLSSVVPDDHTPASDSGAPILTPVLHECDDNYTIYFKDLSFLVDSDQWDPSRYTKAMYCPQVDGMEDSEKQNRINHNIASVSLEWIIGLTSLAGEPDLPEIYCHSGRYLSYRNIFQYGDKRVYYSFNFVTIDLITGDRVFLKNLLDVSDEFIITLQQGNIVNAVDGWRVWYDTEEEALVMLRKALREKTHEELYEMLDNEQFYLKNGELVFNVDATGGTILYCNDIEEFLKVPKW